VHRTASRAPPLEIHGLEFVQRAWSVPDVVVFSSPILKGCASLQRSCCRTMGSEHATLRDHRHGGLCHAAWLAVPQSFSPPWRCRASFPLPLCERGRSLLGDGHQAKGQTLEDGCVGWPFLLCRCSCRSPLVGSAVDGVWGLGATRICVPPIVHYRYGLQ